MTTEHLVVEVELRRAVLDDEHMAEKRADRDHLALRTGVLVFPRQC